MGSPRRSPVRRRVRAVLIAGQGGRGWRSIAGAVAKRFQITSRRGSRIPVLSADNIRWGHKFATRSRRRKNLRRVTQMGGGEWHAASYAANVRRRDVRGAGNYRKRRDGKAGF